MIPFIRLNPKTLALTYTGKRYGNRGVFPSCMLIDSSLFTSFWKDYIEYCFNTLENQEGNLVYPFYTRGGK